MLQKIIAFSFDVSEGVLEGFMINEKRIADYKVIKDVGGNRYRFYCELSGALVCATGVYKADDPEEELLLAWESEGKKCFNSCSKCGKLVSDAMFNVEVLECVECAPFEVEAKFCKNCGVKIQEPNKPCPVCGKPLSYYGKEL